MYYRERCATLTKGEYKGEARPVLVRLKHIMGTNAPEGLGLGDQHHSVLLEWSDKIKARFEV